jgi:hypothetical protein
MSRLTARLLHSLLIVATVLLLRPTLAVAQATDPRALSNRGIEHFRNGEYDLALSDFQASYALNPLPELLFNIAQAYRMQGNCPMALRSYNEYLSSAPRGLMQRRAAARIAALHECRDASAPAPAEPEAAESDPVPAPAPASPELIRAAPVPEAQPPPPSRQAVVATSSANPPHPPSRKGWVWGVVAASAVVVAGAITIGVVFGSSDRYPPPPSLGSLHGN